MLVDEIANLVHVPFGEHAPVVHQQDVGRQRLDLVKDVARDDDVAPVGRPVAKEANRLAARERIHPGQRLVEDEQFGLVRERLRQLDALAHALAVGADALVGGVLQIDLLERRHRGVGGLAIAEAVQAQQRRHPFVTGHPVVERVLLGTHAHAQEDVGIAPYRLAENLHCALVRLQLPGDELEERRLARAIRSEQAGHAAADGDRDVVEPDHLAVPLRQVLGPHDFNLPFAVCPLLSALCSVSASGRHVTTSIARIRRRRTNAEATMMSTITVAEMSGCVS